MLQRLINIVKRLRVEDPWTVNMTSEKLTVKFTEEFSEVIVAIFNKDKENLEEELGDLLFHIILFAEIEDIDVDYIIAGICDKMEKRHLNKEDV